MNIEWYERSQARQKYNPDQEKSYLTTVKILDHPTRKEAIQNPYKDPILFRFTA